MHFDTLPPLNYGLQIALSSSLHSIHFAATLLILHDYTHNNMFFVSILWLFAKNRLARFNSIFFNLKFGRSIISRNQNTDGLMTALNCSPKYKKFKLEGGRVLR